MRTALAILAVLGGLSGCYQHHEVQGCVYEGRFYADGEIISEMLCPALASSRTRVCVDGAVHVIASSWDGPPHDAGPRDGAPRCPWETSE